MARKVKEMSDSLCLLEANEVLNDVTPETDTMEPLDFETKKYWTGADDYYDDYIDF